MPNQEPNRTEPGAGAAGTADRAAEARTATGPGLTTGTGPNVVPGAAGAVLRATGTATEPLTLPCPACGLPLTVTGDRAAHRPTRRAWAERVALYRERVRTERIPAERIYRAGAWAATEWAPAADCPVTLRAVVTVARPFGRPDPEGAAEGWHVTPRDTDYTGPMPAHIRNATAPLRTVWTRDGGVNRVPMSRVVSAADSADWGV